MSTTHKIAIGGRTFEATMKPGQGGGYFEVHLGGELIGRGRYLVGRERGCTDVSWFRPLGLSGRGVPQLQILGAITDRLPM